MKGEKTSPGWSFASSKVSQEKFFIIDTPKQPHKAIVTFAQSRLDIGYQFPCPFSCKVSNNWFAIFEYHEAGCFSTQNQYCIHFTAASMYSGYLLSSRYIISFGLTVGTLMNSLQAYRFAISISLFSLWLIFLRCTTETVLFGHQTTWKRLNMSSIHRAFKISIVPFLPEKQNPLYLYHN